MGNSGIECVDCGDKLLQNLLQGLSLDLCTGCRAISAAVAERFQNRLHIARADGACADDDLSVVREENEGGGNAGNVDQFIRGLRRDHAGELFVYAGNGDLIPVQPRRLDNAIAQKRIVQICLKQLLTSTGSAPALRRYAADSNVRGLVRMEKFFVSNTIPDRSACASIGFKSR